MEKVQRYIHTPDSMTAVSKVTIENMVRTGFVLATDYDALRRQLAAAEARLRWLEEGCKFWPTPGQSIDGEYERWLVLEPHAERKE